MMKYRRVVAKNSDNIEKSNNIERKYKRIDKNAVLSRSNNELETNIIDGKQISVIKQYGELTYGQLQAFTALLDGKDCFITGGAGVGKSFLIQKFVAEARKDGKRVVVCAPTGVAALRIGGKTIHNQFEISVKNSGVYTKQDFYRYKGAAQCFQYEDNKRINELYFCDIVVIDEISMVRGDLFEIVLGILDGILNNKSDKFTKKIQLVILGDFYQLPPILKKNPPTILYEDCNNRGINGNPKRYYITEEQHYFINYRNTTGYAFLSKKWDFDMFFLDEVVRQSNADHALALNKIRVGDVEGYNWVLKNSAQNEIPGAIYCCGKNKMAKARNDEALSLLHTRKREYRMKFEIVEEDLTTMENLKSEATKILEEKLILKIGCKVISTVNQYSEDNQLLYMNGSQGTVVDLYDDFVQVQFGDKIFDVGYRTWETTSRVITIIDDEMVEEELILAKYSQIPLILGYALTTHKMQGMTVDAINVVDCNDFPGQLYVALSRCTSIGKTYFKSDSPPKVSKLVSRFYKNPKSVQSNFRIAQAKLF